MYTGHPGAPWRARLQPGALVTLVRREARAGAAHVLTRTIARVTELVPLEKYGETFVLMTPLRVFCWVDGYHEKGRALPSQVGTVCAELCELEPLFC